MSLFATQFLLKRMPTEAEVVATVLAWLRGMKASTVLNTADTARIERESPELRSASGEGLVLRDLFSEGGTLSAIGFRHEIPDEQGRLWRTEAVARSTSEGPLLRVRGQCLARQALADLSPPRRPHIVRMFLEEEKACCDGLLVPGLLPHRISPDDEGLLLAQAILEGTASTRLPIVWVSATGAGQWALEPREIDQMSVALAGVAHVVLEPDRAFSFRLKDLSGGLNAYGGTIGLGIPGRGLVRRLFIGWQLPDSRALKEAVIQSVSDYCSGMPKGESWDWTDLQEARIRADRDARISVQEDRDLVASFDAEIAEKDAAIVELRQQLQDLSQRLSNRNEGRGDGGALGIPDIGPELYPGEFHDRLRAIAGTFREIGPDKGWDKRSLAVADAILRAPPSPQFSVLEQEIDAATRAPAARMAADIQRLLVRHGYEFKSNNGHPRLEAKPDMPGLETITLSTSPSDHRAGQNMKRQIKAAMGLQKLS